MPTPRSPGTVGRSTAPLACSCPGLSSGTGAPAIRARGNPPCAARCCTTTTSRSSPSTGRSIAGSSSTTFSPRTCSAWNCCAGSWRPRCSRPWPASTSRPSPRWPAATKRPSTPLTAAGPASRSRCSAMKTLVANSGSCGERELEASEVAGAGAVQGVAVPPGVEADEVEGDRRVDVFEVGLGQPAVAGAAHAGDGDGLPDGALDPGAQGVSRLPVPGALRGAGGLQGVVEPARLDGELPAAAFGGGALLADRARPACPRGELHHHRLVAVLGGLVPGGAGLALRAGGLPGVPVDGERPRLEPAGGPGLGGGVGQ